LPNHAMRGTFAQKGRVGMLAAGCGAVGEWAGGGKRPKRQRAKLPNLEMVKWSKEGGEAVPLGGGLLVGLYRK